MRVMIVEDEPASAEYISAILSRYVPTAEVCAMAENGEEALEMLKTTRTDVVITDVYMPRMDGLTMTEKLKKRYPNLHVIIVSGYQEFEYARKALRCGVVDYLLKPVKLQELAQCLNAFAPNAFSESPVEDRKEETVFTPLEQYVEAHLSEAITLPMLCRKCCVSQTTANRIFRKYTNMSFLEYLTQRRIEKAKEMLKKNPTLLIKNVATECGFTNPLYFSKVFKNFTGCTPTEYVSK